MKCPKCENDKTQVLETRKVEGGAVMKRTRSCGCGSTFVTYEVSGGIWPSVQKWALNSHEKALKKQRALRKRNTEIIARVRKGETRQGIASELGLSPSMVSTITTKAKLPRNFRRFDQIN